MSTRSTRSLVLIALGHLVIELCSSSLPVIYPVLMVTLGLTHTQVGLLALVSSLGTSVMQPLFGYFSDRWNPGRMSVLSVAWIGAILGLLGLVNSYALLVMIVGLGELGSAAFHPPAALVASAAGGTRRGAAVSVFSVGGAVGSALSPLLIAAGVGLVGTRSTLVLVPIALLFSLLLYVQVGRVTPLRNRPAAAHAEGRHERNLTGLALIVLAVMCLAWFQVSFKTYLSIWVQSQSHALAVSGQVLFVFLAALGVGSMFGGAIADRIGHWQLIVFCMGLAIPLAWFFVSTSGLWVWVTVALLGMLVGATFPVTIVMAQEAWPGGMGVASGLVMGLGWVPGGIGASLTGWVADHASLGLGLRLSVLPVALGVICVLGYAWTLQRRKEAS